LTGAALAAPFIVMMVVFVIYPFVRLVQAAIGPPDGLGNLKVFFANTANMYVLTVTFRDAAITTLIVFVLGGLLAWSLRTTTSRIMKTVLLSAIFVPFWMGSVVKIYAFSVLLGRTGIVNTALLELHVINAPLHLLYTQFAVIAGMVYQMLPFAVLPMYVAFSTIDSDLLLAAESLGASRIRAMLNVVVPLAMPGILATIIINYVISLGFYLTPVLLGGATQPFTASLIQEDLFSYFDISGAAIGGLVLLLGGLVAVTIGYLLVGKERLRRAISA
jgi:putative spermidine/putrescine transport system permease protein